MESQLEALCSQAAEFLPPQFKDWQAPRFFVQCGPGFDNSQLFDSTPQSLDFGKLPGMSSTKTPDQEHPRLLFGHSSGVPVLATSGHRHLFEGNGILPCILPLCTANRLGSRNIILIDSGLSLQKELKLGSWLLLTDYINGHHCSPLDGNHHMLPNPFPDMTHALSQPLNSELMNALDSMGLSPRLGVYMSCPGSQFCTVSEANIARLGGADIIGHDMVMEIMMGHALGCRVSAFALAALPAPDYYGQPLKRSNLLETCAFCSDKLMRGIRKAIHEIVG